MTMTRAELMCHALSQRRAARLISCGREAVGFCYSIATGNNGVGELVVLLPRFWSLHADKRPNDVIGNR